MKTLLASILLLVVLSAATFAQTTHNHTVTITNRSGDSIMQVYISRSDSGNWGSDRLGRNTMDDGESQSVDLLGHVSWDFKIVEEDGETCLIRENLNRDMTILITPTQCGVVPVRSASSGISAMGGVAGLDFWLE